MTRMLEVVKRAAVEAVQSMKPSGVMFGTVLTTTPLQVQTEQKLTLSSAQLVLSKSLTDYAVAMSGEGLSGIISVKSGLQAGDKVILLQEQGGQRYVVLDRIG